MLRLFRYCRDRMTPYYQDDSATIYHGDCREILLNLPKVDLVLTDPPYGIKGAQCKRGGQQHGKSLAPSTDYGSLAWDNEPAEDEIIRMLLDMSQHLIMWGGNYYAMPPMPGWFFWNKKTGNNTYADGELAWTNLPQALRMITYQWKGMFRKGNDVRVHPTQKPLEVMLWCIIQADKHGNNETILDPFMGSGTTLRAAKDLNRKSIGIELEEKYCKIAATRLSQGVLDFSESIPGTDKT